MVDIFSAQTFHLPLEKARELDDEVEELAQTDTYCLSGGDEGVAVKEGGCITYRLEHLPTRTSTIIKVILDSNATSELLQLQALVKELAEKLDPATSKPSKQTLRSLLSEQEVSVKDQVRISLVVTHSAIIEENGILSFEEKRFRTVGSFLRYVLKRPAGGNDYKRVEIYTKGKSRSWASLKNKKNEDTCAELRITEKPDIDMYKSQLYLLLLHAGVRERNMQAFLDNPFAQPTNLRTIDETARELLHTRFPDNPSSTVDDIFSQLDLEPAASNHLESIARDLVPHYGHREAAAIAIEYATGARQRLPIDGNFCRSGEVLDKPTDDNGTIVYNMSTKSANVSEQLADKAGLQRPSKHSSFSFVYHATTWADANNILSSRIKPHLGRLNLDFGCQGSFYVATSFKMAVLWSQIHRRNWRNQNAILVYTLPKSLAVQDGLKWITLDYPRPWKSIVCKSRNGEDTDVDEVDFVEGPYLLDASSPRPLTEEQCKPSKKLQIAIKTTKAAKFLASRFLGIIYFSQNDDGAFGF